MVKIKPRNIGDRKAFQGPLGERFRPQFVPLPERQSQFGEHPPGEDAFVSSNANCVEIFFPFQSPILSNQGSGTNPQSGEPSCRITLLDNGVNLIQGSAENFVGDRASGGVSCRRNRPLKRNLPLVCSSGVTRFRAALCHARTSRAVSSAGLISTVAEKGGGKGGQEWWPMWIEKGN